MWILNGRNKDVFYFKIYIEDWAVDWFAELDSIRVIREFFPLLQLAFGTGDDFCVAEKCD